MPYYYLTICSPYHHTILPSDHSTRLSYKNPTILLSYQLTKLSYYHTKTCQITILRCYYPNTPLYKPSTILPYYYSITHYITIHSTTIIIYHHNTILIYYKTTILSALQLYTLPYYYITIKLILPYYLTTILPYHHKTYYHQTLIPYKLPAI